MSRRNEGKTKPDVLYRKREILLKESDNRLLQLEKILQVLKDIDDSLIRKLHKRELARNERLRKLCFSQRETQKTGKSEKSCNLTV